MKSDLEKRVVNLEQEVSALRQLVSSGTPVGRDAAREGKAPSPKEFLISRKPRNDVETTFTLFYYAERFQGHSSSTIGDIEKLFRESRVPVPTNLNDKVNKNIAKGLLTSAKEKKDGKSAWVVTLTGEQTFNN